MKPTQYDPNHINLTARYKNYIIKLGGIIHDRQYPFELQQCNDITSMLNRTASDLIVILDGIAQEVEIKTSYADKGFNIEAMPLIEQLLRFKRYPDYKFTYVCKNVIQGHEYIFNQSNVPTPDKIIICKKDYPSKDIIDKLAREIWTSITPILIDKIPDKGSGDPYLHFNNEQMSVLKTEILK